MMVNGERKHENRFASKLYNVLPFATRHSPLAITFIKFKVFSSPDRNPILPLFTSTHFRWPENIIFWIFVSFAGSVSIVGPSSLVRRFVEFDYI